MCCCLDKAVSKYVVQSSHIAGFVLCERSSHLTRDGTSAHVNIDGSATWAGMQAAEPRGTDRHTRVAAYAS